MESPTARPAAGYDRARHGIHNLRRAEVIADPRLYWKAISELPPVFYDEVGGVWVCSGYAESVEILANHRAFSSARHHSPDDLAARGMSGIVPTAEMLSAQFLFNDPPDHTRIRNALRGEFSPAGLQRHDAALRAIADRVLDTLPDTGTVDLVKDFAERLPEHLMTHLLGMTGRGTELTEWADAYERLLSSVSTFPSRADLETVPLLDKALAGLRELAAERLAAPGDDLVSTLATALRDDFAVDPAAEPPAELLQLVAANALVLVAGGYQTLTHLVSGGLLLLADHPEQLRQLRQDHSLADSAVAEVLRIDGSSQYVGRHAARDIEIGGARMAAGDGVLVLLAAANLDPRKFTDPTAFDIARSEGRHLGFGSGPHYCLGAPFAERLARWAILGFVERYQRFGLSPLEADPVEWGPHCNTRSRRRATVLVSRTEGSEGFDFSDGFEVSEVSEVIATPATSTTPAAPAAPAADAVPAAKAVTDLERHQIVAEWNDTGADDGAAQVCWQLLFEERARLAPDSTAVEDEGVVYSYADIDALANGAAHRLRELGVEPETVVAISMERSVRLVVAILAVAKAGGAFLLAAADCPGERLRTMLEQTSARLVIADDATGDRIAALGVPADVVRLDPAVRAAAPPITGVAPGNTAYVVFTSGTTGRPKAIANSHEALTNLHIAQRTVFRVRPQDRVLQFLSLNFDGCISEAVLALLCGATLVVARTAQLTPGPPLLRLLRERRVSVAIMTPSVWSVLGRDPLPNLRIAAFAGERLPGALVRRWTAPGRRLLNLYGPAEAAVWSTWHECAGEDDPPIGRPVAGKRVYVLDEEHRLLPAGSPGELYIAGIGVGRYLGRPDLMAESFVPDPFAGRPGRLMYRSGDLCVWREDGSLEYVGRRDRQVKIRGQRVELYEVERVLEKAPGVSACHAVERDNRLHAFVVPEEPGSWDEQAVRRHLAERLHGGMIPAVFTVTEQLPLTSNGKVAQEHDATASVAVSAVAAPVPVPAAAAPVPVPAAPDADAGSTRVTWELARLFSSCLRVPQVHVKLDTDFFSAGGDSLAMAEFMAAAEDRFGMVIDIQRLLDEPTLAGLVQLVSEGRTVQ